jgi:hypothetical protein
LREKFPPNLIEYADEFNVYMFQNGVNEQVEIAGDTIIG